MCLLKKTKGLLVLHVFFVITSANASLTSYIDKDSDRLYGLTVGIEPAIYKEYNQEKANIYIQYNSCIGDIPDIINRYSVSYEATEKSDLRTKSLPSVPRALLMSIVGFACVSLVRDRRFWIHILIALVWAGQSGFNLIPDVVTHLKNQKKVMEYDTLNFRLLYLPENSRNIDNKIEDTDYIGLLRFLAGIPDSVITFQSELFSSRNYSSRVYITNSYKDFCLRLSESRDATSLELSKKDSVLSPFLIYISSAKYISLFCTTNRHIYISQLFDFQKSPRGPP